MSVDNKPHRGTSNALDALIEAVHDNKDAIPGIGHLASALLTTFEIPGRIFYRRARRSRTD